jgi:hypothetical protein
MWPMTDGSPALSNWLSASFYTANKSKTIPMNIPVGVNCLHVNKEGKIDTLAIDPDNTSSISLLSIVSE